MNILSLKKFFICKKVVNLSIHLRSFLLLWQKLKWQKISICKWEFFFRHIIKKTFFHFISIRTNSTACTLWTGWFISFNWICPIQMVNSFPGQIAMKIHFQMVIFFHFDLCPNVRNSFRFNLNKLSFKKFFYLEIKKARDFLLI